MLRGSKSLFPYRKKLKLNQNELNEYRRIKYNQKHRELTQQEKERL